MKELSFEELLRRYRNGYYLYAEEEIVRLKLLSRFSALEARVKDNSKAIDLNQRWNKATSIITCGGSEFIDNPELTAEVVRDSISNKFEMIKKLKLENAELKRQVEDLKKKSVCVYCGHVQISEKVEDKMNDMIEHMAICENHPVPKLLGIIQTLQNWFVDNSKEDTTIGITINNAYVGFCRKEIFNPKFEQPTQKEREG